MAVDHASVSLVVEVHERGVLGRGRSSCATAELPRQEGDDANDDGTDSAADHHDHPATGTCHGRIPCVHRLNAPEARRQMS